MTSSPHTDWNLIADKPLARLCAVRAMANQVFDDEARAATWLGRSNRAVGGGLCAVGAASMEPAGFREALAELTRLQQAEAAGVIRLR